jgi:hypothetical protein
MKNIVRNIPTLKCPPVAGKNLFSDIRNFLIKKPSQKTLVKYSSAQERKEYSERIMQRIGVAVDSYSVLDVHQIAVDAPVQVIFDELLKWNGDSTYWPNYLAQVHRVNERLEEIEILLFGLKRLPFGFFSPLFRLNAIRIQRLPATSDYDNARYLLYRCSGGYPIGVFSMYVRSSIARRNEALQSQLFMAVGFDFYGRKTKFKLSPINKVWELIHDRVTANMLSRLKQLCEWRFEKIQGA